MKRMSFPAALMVTALASIIALAGYGCKAGETSTAPATTPTATISQAATGDIDFEIVSISAAHPGDDVTVSIKTAPGAEVKIAFTMPSGSVSAYPEDNTKTAGADGLVTWTWNINSHVAAGEATYTFTITLNGLERTETIKKTI